MTHRLSTKAILAHSAGADSQPTDRARHEPPASWGRRLAPLNQAAAKGHGRQHEHPSPKPAGAPELPCPGVRPGSLPRYGGVAGVAMGFGHPTVSLLVLGWRWRSTETSWACALVVSRNGGKVTSFLKDREFDVGRRGIALLAEPCQEIVATQPFAFESFV
jgi:hypothetical protein